MATGELLTVAPGSIHIVNSYIYRHQSLEYVTLIIHNFLVCTKNDGEQNEERDVPIAPKRRKNDENEEESG